MAKLEFLFDLVSNEQVLEKLFREADDRSDGELDAVQLQKVHATIRGGGVSLRQTEAAIRDICSCGTCDFSEFFDVLNEMDRRYYLVQDLQWEFALLDGKQKGTIYEKDARFLFQAVHDEYFSHRRWLQFLRDRPVPGTAISFAEIEVELCDIPSPEWLEEDVKLEEIERAALVKAQQAKLQKEQARLKNEQEAKKREKQKEETRAMKERMKKEQRRKQMKIIEDEKFEKEKKRKESEERRREEEELRKKEEAERLKQEEMRRRQEEEEARLREEELRKMEELEASKKWKKDELLRQQQLEQERIQQEKAEREMLENAEADEAEEMADFAADAEEEAVEAARLAGIAAQQAEDDASREAAKEAEKKALAEAQANKEKRLRASLKAAQKSRKLEKLERSIKEAKEAKLPSLKKPIDDAVKTHREVQLGINLKEATASRSLAKLDKAIKEVKDAGVESVFQVELSEAERMAQRLRRLERIRREILELKQSTISEIRSYQNPPPAVHQVMIATYLLLSYSEKPLKDWKNIQALLGKTGKEGLKRQVTTLDPMQVSDSMADYTESHYLKEHELDTIRDVSAGAATFYVWATNMIEEARACVEQRQKLAEDDAKRKAQEEQERKKAQEKEKARREARQKRQQERELNWAQHKTSSTNRSRKPSRAESREQLIKRRTSSLDTTSRRQSRTQEAGPVKVSPVRKVSGDQLRRK